MMLKPIKCTEKLTQIIGDFYFKKTVDLDVFFHLARNHWMSRLCDWRSRMVGKLKIFSKNIK